MSRIDFYYRQGCHLCDEMWQLLTEQGWTGRCQIHTTNVDSDPELTELYGNLVPVLASGNKIICNYYLDPDALERHLSGQQP